MLTSLLLKKVEFIYIGEFGGRRPWNPRAFSQRNFLPGQKPLTCGYTLTH
jgi:hypothetical protein